MIAEQPHYSMSTVSTRRGPQVGDLWLLNATVALTVLGVLLVLSTSYAWSAVVNDTSRSYAVRQLCYAVAGFIAMIAALLVDYRRLRGISEILLLVTVLALIAVFLPVIGHSDGGASRWIRLRFANVQPSEFAKLVIVLYLARYFTDSRYAIARRPSLLAPLIVLGVVAGLVMIEPDLGTASILFLGGLSVLYAAEVRMRKLLVILGALAVGVLCVVAVSWYRGGYQAERIKVFLNPENDPKQLGLQAQRSGLAIGSGMLTGMGLGRGREKYYIPVAHTDYIFATYAEETGFLGSVLLIGLYLFILQRGYAIAMRCQDGFGRLVATGISTTITGQAVLNLMVTTCMVPSTGMPLPLVSYGGSSLVTVLASIGILLSIAHRNPPVPRQRARVPVRAR